MQRACISAGISAAWYPARARDRSYYYGGSPPALLFRDDGCPLEIQSQTASIVPAHCQRPRTLWLSTCLQRTGRICGPVSLSAFYGQSAEYRGTERACRTVGRRRRAEPSGSPLWASVPVGVVSYTHLRAHETRHDL